MERVVALRLLYKKGGGFSNGTSRLGALCLDSSYTEQDAMLAERNAKCSGISVRRPKGKSGSNVVEISRISNQGARHQVREKAQELGKVESWDRLLDIGKAASAESVVQ